ncbi:hypothetical protein Bca52824_090282 [Brassica carinata]|uniref:Protein YIP n=2 Tax=Brassica TaxID=3705 RepID=A0A8X7THC3_BRACI|nr:hypothetical protein Bca52824_090282 [Brassica carinata]
MINNDGSVLPARPSIPVTSSPFVQSNLPPLPPPSGDFSSSSEGSKTMGFGSPANTHFQSEVFAVAFALLAAGAVILTLNVLLLGAHIIFFQSLSLLGYCLFPPDVGAVICMLKDNVILKMIVAWSSWAAYPFMSAAKKSSRTLSSLPHACLCRLLDHCH